MTRPQWKRWWRYANVTGEMFAPMFIAWIIFWVLVLILGELFWV